PRTPISTVRQRFYMGWCWPGLDREAVLAPFRRIRPEVAVLYQTFPYLDEGVARETVAYFDQFFDLISDGDRAQRRMFRDCRELPG
ncbi:MAG: hypothetical protein PVJ02_08045, partial [Gemmatimonadota bacterium]